MLRFIICQAFRCHKKHRSRINVHLKKISPNLVKYERLVLKIIVTNFNVEETWSLVDELHFEALNNLINQNFQNGS